jgi:multidrug efflux pump subunit AcrA (membrane-fusion protein)
MPNLVNRLRPRPAVQFTKFKAIMGRLVGGFPLFVFIIFLALLVGLIVVGDRWRKPTEEVVEVQTEPKEVSIYEVGGTPTIKAQAKVEKSGVIKLVAQTAGVVQKIKVSEGDHVKRGSAMFILSTNYQGANAAAVSRQISAKNYRFLVDSYDAQLAIINRNREIANKSEAQASELRAIARQSFDETRSAIALNEDIINSLDQQIRLLEQNAPSVTNDQAILQFKQAKSGALAALNGLKAGLRNAEYLNSENQEPAEIARLAKDNTLQQLDIQEKTLALNRDVAKLSLRLAQISESLMYPGSPCPGTVERIHVKVGQVVQPGTLLATIRGDENEATAVVLATQAVASRVSQLEPSYAQMGDHLVGVMPRSISEEPTDGALHSILYSLPEELSSLVTNESYIEMTLPMGAEQYAKSHDSFIPLDSVYQGQNKNVVNIIEVQDNGSMVARSREVKLGKVTGQYVEVIQGLYSGDRVIINRNIVDGEVITYAQN